VKTRLRRAGPRTAEWKSGWWSTRESLERRQVAF